MNYPMMHNDPVYESIQQKPGDQQGGVKIVENKQPRTRANAGI